MKCTCTIHPTTLAPMMCNDCWEVIIEEPRRKNAYTVAGQYSTMNRGHRIAYRGEHYARPMPSKEYVYQVLLGKETV